MTQRPGATSQGVSETIANTLLSSSVADYYAMNGIQLAERCAARGRYELAEFFQRLGARSYDVNVVRKRDPLDSDVDKAHQREFLQSYKDKIKEFPLLVDTRRKILGFLAKHPAGIERNKLKRDIAHAGTTSHGVICNQLAKGGWLHQEKKEKKFTLWPASAPPVSDLQFLESEGLLPNQLAAEFDSVAPLASAIVSESPRQRPSRQKSGCLTQLLLLTTVAVIGSVFLIDTVLF
jgi:hypothetical protein